MTQSNAKGDAMIITDETMATSEKAGTTTAETGKTVTLSSSSARKPSRIIAAGLAALMLSTTLTALPTDLAPADALSAETAYAAQLTAGSLKANSTSANSGNVKASSETYLNYSNGTFMITSCYSGKCIDVPNASTGNNVAVKTYTNNGTLAQRFYVSRVSNGVYTLQAGCSGRYLADRSGTVVQQTKSNSSYQRWRFVMKGSYAMLKNVGSGRYITVGSSGNFASLTTRAKTGYSNQLFRVNSSQLIASGYYALQSATGGRYLDLSAAGTANNQNVQIWSGNGTNAQKWCFRHMGNNYYRIESAASGKALDLRYNSTANGVNVVQYSCCNWSTQLWHAEICDGGNIMFVNKYYGKALDVNAAANFDGANVQVWNRNSNGPAQRWTLIATKKIPAGSRSVNMNGITIREVTDYNGVKTVSIPNGTYTFRSAVGRMLDVAGDSKNPGANVHIWANNGSNAQKFTLKSVGNGYYEIYGATTNYALDVVNGINANGTNVRMWYANNSGAQRWRAVLYGNDLAFVNECTGRALDVNAAANRDGVNVQIWGCNSNGPAQRWMLSRTTVAPVNTFVNVDECYNTLNMYRSWCGRGGMVRDIALENYAKLRAQELVSKFSHTRPNGEDTRDQIKRIKGDVARAENIARGHGSCSQVMKGWYDSTGHRNNMLHAGLTRVGIAGYSCNGTIYWVQVFSG